jgi:hypothetical protein
MVSGFNMKNDLAVFIPFAAFLVDGNQLTNLMSIGPKSHETGEDSSSPAIVGGLNTHGVFEGIFNTYLSFLNPLSQFPAIYFKAMQA